MPLFIDLIASSVASPTAGSEPKKDAENGGCWFLIGAQTTLENKLGELRLPQAVIGLCKCLGSTLFPSRPFTLVAFPFLLLPLSACEQEVFGGATKSIRNKEGTIHAAVKKFSRAASSQALIAAFPPLFFFFSFPDFSLCHHCSSIASAPRVSQPLPTSPRSLQSHHEPVQDPSTFPSRRTCYDEPAL